MSEVVETPSELTQESCKTQDPIDNMNMVYSKAESDRDAIVDKLKETITSIQFNPDLDKPSVTEAKLRIVEVALSALSHKEKSAMDKVNVSLKQKEHTNNVAIGQTVVELLKTIKVAPPPSTGDAGTVVISDYQDTQIQLDRACSEAGVVIKEGELYKDSKEGIG